MADENGEEEADEPIVELDDGTAVEGVPLARVASRLTWGIEKSEIERRAGDVEIRTPEGPRAVSDVLAEINISYFERCQEFESSVCEVVGTGPVPTADE